MLKNNEEAKLEALIFEAFSSQPHLLPSIGINGIDFTGTFEVCVGDEVLLAVPVSINVSARFPDVEPIVVLRTERFPFDIDRHISFGGECCVCIWEYWLATAGDVSFASFLDGPVRQFFISQLHYEAHGEWPFGEWAHNSEGLVAAYSELLGVKKDVEVTVSSLERIVRRGRARGRVTTALAQRMRDRLIAAERRKFLDIQAIRMRFFNEEAIQDFVKAKFEVRPSMKIQLRTSTAVAYDKQVEFPSSWLEALWAQILFRMPGQ